MCTYSGKYFECIDFCPVDSVSEPQSHVLLCLSQLSGHQWIGYVQICPSIDEVSSNPTQCLELGDTIKCGRWLNQNRILCGFDSGIVSCFSYERECLSFVFSHPNHDSTISQIDLKESRFLTGSFDQKIGCWDVEAMNVITNFTAHSKPVTDVAFSPSGENRFLSSSLDHCVYLWDIAEKLPVLNLALDYSAFGNPTSLVWQDDYEHLVVMGTESGALLLKDLRNVAENLSIEYCAHKRAVTSLAYLKRQKVFASGADDCMVAVTAFSLDDTSDGSEKQKPHESSVIYHDDRHRDFVKQVICAPTFNDENSQVASFYSVGWDNKILLHTLSAELAEY